MAIQFIEGDATAPWCSGPRIIVHVVNDGGGWGRGFVLALSARWKEPEQAYRAWSKSKSQLAAPFALGEVQFVEVEAGLWVANLVGQHGTRVSDGVPPVRYEAIRRGLASVRRFAGEQGASVHMPRIGCGLAGGRWEEVGRIVMEELAAHGVEVSVYDPPAISRAPPDRT